MERSEVAVHREADAATWTPQFHAGRDIYRNALNTPAFLAMLPSVAGLSGLHIGCGEGANTQAASFPRGGNAGGGPRSNQRSELPCHDRPEPSIRAIGEMGIGLPKHNFDRSYAHDV
jgi:hypothetical protein